MIALAHVRTLSVGDTMKMALRIASVCNSGVVRMKKKFVARARLIREILLLLTVALRFVEVVLEFLNKVANCYARKLPAQAQNAG
jgi:hypothetical protein